jgi:hypothetical protein
VDVGTVVGQPHGTETVASWRQAVVEQIGGVGDGQLSGEAVLVIVGQRVGIMMVGSKLGVTCA